jgi:hypothetical protein
VKTSMFFKIVLILIILLMFSGCAYRYYLGMHGPSIKAFPDEHEGVTEDHECLECHHPNKDPEATPTTHPDFTGCLKCHNDDA